MQTNSGKHTVVLLGVGHTNAHVLRMWKMAPLSDAQLICISNFPVASYSGMMPGVLAGQYEADEMGIDLVRLCNSAGARLILDEVIGLDTDTQLIHFRNRPSLSYQALSIGIGSRPTFEGVEIEPENSLIAVKPMQTFLSRLQSRLDDFSTGDNGKKKIIRIAVVGGGIGSIEIAFCLKRRLFDQDCDFEMCLVTGSEKVGAGLLPGTQDKVRSQLREHGIDVVCGNRVSKIGKNGLLLTNDKEVRADLVIWATSAIAPELLDKFELQKDAKGFLATRPTLQTVSSDRVFAVGDTGTIVKSETAKAGVFAVRQGKYLWKNIANLIHDKPLVEYKPQKGFLKLINTADGKAIAEYRGKTFCSPWAWKLKDRIDKKFMKMYQDYSLMPMDMASGDTDTEAEMKCLGCGGKIGSQLLSAVLSELEIPPHPDVIIGLENPDDAAVVKTHGNQVTVTTDFFASPLDDPYLSGRIAVLNSVSDCFVMGAQPTTALTIVEVPQLHSRAQLQIMRELMAGSVEELKKCGATIVGGHSIESPRLTIGFTVLGKQLKPATTKGMLKEGDQLILTKPLGSGIMLAALMQSKMKGTDYQPLVESMLLSNQIALDLILKHNITGITDVTGFGLAGHMAEMLLASKMSAQITVADIPLLPGCQELIDQDIESTLAPDNRRVVERISFSGIDIGSRKVAALFDPQTCGGLLFGVSAKKVNSVLKFLADSGFEDAAVIGEVTRREASSKITLN